MTESQIVAVGVLSLVCFTVGSVANFFSLLYFVFRNRNKCQISNSLFILINATDLLICGLVLPVAMCALSGGQPLIFSVSFFCNAWVFLWYTLCRFSFFLIAVLSIARTHSLVRPFHPFNKYHVLIPVFLYLGILFVQETMPYWYGRSAYYSPNLFSCLWFLDEIFPPNSTLSIIYHLIFVVIETVFPIIIIMASSIFSCFYLKLKQRKRSMVFCGRRPNGAKRPALIHTNSSLNSDSSHAVRLRPEQSAELRSKSATVTIVIIGGACFVLNIPFLLMILLSQVELYTSCDKFCLHESVSEQHLLLIMFLLHTGTMEVNSVVNPFIYIARMKRLRQFISQILFKCTF